MSEPVPLTIQQEGLWYLDRLARGPSAYVEPLARRLRGPLDVDALRGALRDVGARHEALRTRYPSVRGRPVQVVEDGEPPFEVLDLRECRERLPDVLAERSRVRMDLREPVRPRATVLRLADDDHVLHLALHHIACDDWSLTILGRELGQAYAARTGGSAAGLPPVRWQYADFARWQRAWAVDGGLAGQLEHWRRELTPLPPPLELPWDRARPAAPSNRGGWVARPLEGWGLADLAEVAGRYGATPYLVLLGSLAVLLHRWSEQRRFALGLPLANRGRPEVRGTVGLFVNVLPLVVDVEPRDGFGALLAALRARTVSALAGQEVPFPLLVRELGVPADPGRNPLYQATLVVDQPPDPIRLPGLRVEEVDARRGIAKFDLMLEASTRATPPRLGFEYSEDVLDRPTVERLLADLHALLWAIRRSPDAAVADLAEGADA